MIDEPEFPDKNKSPMLTTKEFLWYVDKWGDCPYADLPFWIKYPTVAAAWKPAILLYAYRQQKGLNTSPLLAEYLVAKYGTHLLGMEALMDVCVYSPAT